MRTSLEFMETLERSIDKVVENDLLSKKQSMGTRVLLIKVMTENLFDSLIVSEHVSKSIVHINKLIDQNYTVYKNGLISKEEHDKNGFVLWGKLVKKLQIITKPKIKKATKMDVYSLRAGIDNLENEN